MSGPEGAWPPMPKGATDVHTIPTVERPESLTDERVAAMKLAALADPNVRAALGTRFAYLTADELELPKGQTRPPGTAIPGVLAFYSHSGGMAVRVRMTGPHVDAIERLPELQPAEGADEIAEAIGLARRDERITAAVASLAGYAMLTQPLDDKRPQGQRVLYVSFSKPEDDHSEYFATVDLIQQKVLAAGKAAGR